MATEYEEARARNIARNQQYLAQLGLGAGAVTSPAPDGTGGPDSPGKRRRVASPDERPHTRKLPATAPKKSKRLLGEKAPEYHKVRIAAAVADRREG